MPSETVIQLLHIGLVAVSFVGGIIAMLLAQLVLTDLFPLGGAIGAKQIQLSNIPLGETVLYFDEAGHYEFEPAAALPGDYADDPNWRQWGHTLFGVDYERSAATFNGNVERRDLEVAKDEEIGDDTVARSSLDVERQGHQLFIDLDESEPDDLLVRGYSYLQDMYGVAGMWLYDAAQRHAHGEHGGDGGDIEQRSMIIAMAGFVAMGMALGWILLTGGV